MYPYRPYSSAQAPVIGAALPGAQLDVSRIQMTRAALAQKKVMLEDNARRLAGSMIAYSANIAARAAAQELAQYEAWMAKNNIGGIARVMW